MAGNNGQRNKSSSSFMSIFNIFRSSSSNRKDEYYYSDDRWTKVWHSDEDRGQWGPAEPGIDKKADDFIKRYKQRVTESEVHQMQAPVK